MLAEGIPPKSIAAVTFTELAASELLIRVRNFVSDLASGTIPPSSGSPCRAVFVRSNDLLDGYNTALTYADQKLFGSKLDLHPVRTDSGANLKHS
jgi:ATP-dependent exoDNAse (exonuclease V) beta subunit